MNELTALSPILNVQEPCLCILALDISSSMSGKGINELNNGLQDFYNSVYNSNAAAERLEICLITFGSEVKCVQEPAKVDDFKMPRLYADGTTKLVDGIKLAIKQVEMRKEYYKKNSPQYSRPMIIVMTDGEPDADQDVASLCQLITNDMLQKKYTLHVIGTSDCNYNKIAYFCPKEMIYPLNGLNYSRFFKWLSNSISKGGLNDGESFKSLSGSENLFEQRIIN
jgi:uncharacterized protein YegL